jgi:hypothetical protein
MAFIGDLPRIWRLILFEAKRMGIGGFPPKWPVVSECGFHGGGTRVSTDVRADGFPYRL